MNTPSTREASTAESRIERWHRWFAASFSALLHLLLLLVLLHASKPTVTTPQGAAAGGRMKVDFIGENDPPAKAPPSPRPSPVPPRTQRRPAASPLRSTLVTQAADPVPPPEEVATPSSIPAPSPNEAPQQPAPAPTTAPAAGSPVQRRPETWTGRPPGFIEQDTAPADMGTANSPALERGNRNDAAAGQPSLEVGGYMVIYDLRSETLLRSWTAQGMKELSIPLPGTQYRMVCPLEIALKRGSGKCRLLDPSSPEMQAIGDGREVINMVQVYRRGELVWRGPGPYR